MDLHRETTGRPQADLGTGSEEGDMDLCSCTCCVSVSPSIKQEIHICPPASETRKIQGNPCGLFTVHCYHLPRPAPPIWLALGLLDRFPATV